MAGMQYPRCQTIHSWCGIGDGHMPRESVVHSIVHNSNFAHVKKNILSAEVLIIDEIGLLSERKFEDAEYICRYDIIINLIRHVFRNKLIFSITFYLLHNFRHVRKSEKIFGGIQVLASGSFTQLPPVPDYNDTGAYAFESNIFYKVFPHRFILKQVHRQKDVQLIKAINELCVGSPSRITLDLVRSLKRPLPEDCDPTYIYGTNADANYQNELCLEKVPGNSRTYYSRDKGKTKHLRKCQSPKYLCLKINCKVLVLRNMDNGLVNGISAYVRHMENDIIQIQVERDKHVHHRLQGHYFDIERCLFKERDTSGKVVAERVQFPLKLGYALTVDKAQGRSIENLIIDCYGFWKPSQVGVALGRCIDRKRVQVVNFFNEMGFYQHDIKVMHFYEKESDALEVGLSCCTKHIIERDACISPEKRYPMIANIPPVIETNWNSDVPADELLKSVHPEAVTDFNKTKVKMLKQCEKSVHMKTFIETQWNAMKSIFETYKLFSQGKKCNWCFMIAHLHNYFLFPTYREECKEAWQCDELSEIQNIICTELCFNSLKQITTSNAKDIENSQIREALGKEPVAVDEHLQGVIRYIGGASLHSVNSDLTNFQTGNLTQRAKRKYETSKILCTLKTDQNKLLEVTKYSASVQEVIRRQFAGKTLWHIYDDVFIFFCMLYQRIVAVQTHRMMNICPNRMLQMSIEVLYKDIDCLNKWMSFFETNPEMCQFNSQGHKNSDDSEDECEEEWGGEVKDVNSTVLALELKQATFVDLYMQLVRYFCKVHYSDLLSVWRDNVRSKGQALRAGLLAKELAGIPKKTKCKFPCVKCQKECKSFFKSAGDNSVQCSHCRNWGHYKCFNLTGEEVELQPGNDEMPWHCDSCKAELHECVNGKDNEQDISDSHTFQDVDAETVNVEEPPKSRTINPRRCTRSSTTSPKPQSANVTQPRKPRNTNGSRCTRSSTTSPKPVTGKRKKEVINQGTNNIEEDTDCQPKIKSRKSKGKETSEIKNKCQKKTEEGNKSNFPQSTANQKGAKKEMLKPQVANTNSQSLISSRGRKITKRKFFDS